jgi:hypothetical protein
MTPSNSPVARIINYTAGEAIRDFPYCFSENEGSNCQSEPPSGPDRAIWHWKMAKISMYNFGAI